MKKNRSLIMLLGLWILSQAVTASAAEIGHKERGDQLLRDQKPKLAIQEYQEALQSNPDSAATLFNLAIAYYSIRKIDDTISTLEKLIALDGSDVEAKYNLGCLLLYTGDATKAESVFNEAKICCPQDSEFLPRLTKGLELIEELQKTDRSTQDLLAMITKNGLPAD